MAVEAHDRDRVAPIGSNDLPRTLLEGDDRDLRGFLHNFLGHCHRKACSGVCDVCAAMKHFTEVGRLGVDAAVFDDGMIIQETTGGAVLDAATNGQNYTEPTATAGNLER